MNLSIFPVLNALLNTASALLLVLGFLFIRQKAVTAHKTCMLSACVCSTLFLISYLYYHYHHGITRFPNVGFAKVFYTTLLFTHTVLAVVTLPLVIWTLTVILKGNIERHKKIARYTFPIWLYVSVTGVVVYWMLYQVNWTG